MIENVPLAAKLVAHCAVRTLPDPVNGTAPQPVIEEPPFVKATAPVGFEAVTVAVKITFLRTRVGLSELASVVPGAGGPLGVQASTSVRKEYVPAALLMTTRILLVLVAVKDTVRLTRLLPETEPSVAQAEPFQACTSKAVTPG